MPNVVASEMSKLFAWQDANGGVAPAYWDVSPEIYCALKDEILELHKRANQKVLVNPEGYLLLGGVPLRVVQ